MPLDATSKARFNLSKATILLVDSTPMGMAILVQIISGLGAKNIHRCATVAEAQGAARAFEFDLIIADALGSGGEGYDLARWLRTEGPDANRFAPILMTAGHTPRSGVIRARDCGANFTLKKPLSPMAVLERVLWIGRDVGFVASDTYVGPERRFRDDPPPDGEGRRREDRAAAARVTEPEPERGSITETLGNLSR